MVHLDSHAPRRLLIPCIAITKLRDYTGKRILRDITSNITNATVRVLTNVPHREFFRFFSFSIFFSVCFDLFRRVTSHDFYPEFVLPYSGFFLFLFF